MRERRQEGASQDYDGIMEGPLAGGGRGETEWSSDIFRNLGNNIVRYK